MQTRIKRKMKCCTSVLLKTIRYCLTQIWFVFIIPLFIVKVQSERKINGIYTKKGGNDEQTFGITFKRPTMLFILIILLDTLQTLSTLRVYVVAYVLMLYTIQEVHTSYVPFQDDKRKRKV